MNASWLTEFIRLFMPEDSSGLNNGNSFTTAFQPLNKTVVSLKALVWTAISIGIGLVIGQLN